jgi:hypothetical protein
VNRHRPLKIIAALAALAWTAGAGLAADVPGHISYQGMLMDGSTPFTGEANFRFALVDSLTGDTFWTNDGTAGYPAEAVRIGVQDGVFSVLLGAAPMAPIDPSTIATFTRDQALRIWVEIGSHGEVLLGNLPLSSVLFAHQAELARASDGDFAAQGEIWSQSGGFRFPDGTVQETAAGSGGGDCLWTAGTYSKIYYNAGNVGIGTDNPQYPLSLQKSAGSNIVPMAIFQTTGTGSAAALRFQNALDDHFNLGITGGSHLALGYNANIGLSGDVVRITPDGDVGIGRTNPSAKLDVNGSVRMTGLQLGTSATAGHVLTADASGVGTWQPAPAGGESLWQKNGSMIYYDEGNVGIGRTSAYYPLHLLTANSSRGVNIVNERAPQTGLHTHGLYSSAEGSAVGIPDAKNFGVTGKATNAEVNHGVYGNASNGTTNHGVTGNAICTEATSNIGVYGVASGGTWNRAIYGSTGVGEQNWAGYFVGRGYFSGNVGIGSSDPLYPLTVITNSQNCAATFHNSEATSYSTYGLSSQAIGDIGGAPGSIHTGIKSTASNADWNFGVYATASDGAYNYAGYFIGDTHVTGTLSKGAGSFKIDHPLDPANKYLSHSFVESPDMMNIYNGNVVTDGSGRATIELPDWFEPLNRDFRYQLTVIDETDSDTFVQAKIVRGVRNGSFDIRTSAPHATVSWQVTGIRQDAFANAHRIPVEEDKPLQERGTYLHAEALGFPADLQVDRVREARIENHR